MLVLLAVLISAFRLLLPYVHNYRQDLQDYININNQTNMIIGELSMSWQKTGPILIAQNVSLLDTDTAHVYIKRLDIQIDFWRSIIEQQLVSSNVILSGTQITFDQDLWAKNNTLSNTYNTKQITSFVNTTNQFEFVSSLFLNQIRHFSVHDSQVIIYKENAEREFSIQTLKWLNNGTSHKAQGDIIVDGVSATNIQMKIDLDGENYQDLSGQLYLQANQLDITTWLDAYLAIENDKTTSNINFSAWLTIQNSNINKVQFELLENKVDWLYNNEAHQLALSTGQLLLVQGDKEQSFTLHTTPFFLQYNQQESAEFTVQIVKNTEKTSAYLSSFDLSIFSELYPLFSAKKQSRELVEQLALTGQVRQLVVEQRGENLQAIAEFSHVNNEYSQGIPGIDNASGKVTFSEQNLHLTFSASQGFLDFKHHFVAPIAYHSFDMNVNASFDDNGWMLKANNIVFVSDELSLSADVNVSAPVNGDASMALLATVINADASTINHYYPLTSMSKGLVGYLNDSIVDGTIEQAQVLINGSLSKFPFDDGSGIFVVDAELTHSTFKFSPDWAAINNFNANLNFTNNSMLITGRSGELVGLDVAGVKAAIDDLAHAQVLNVETIIKPSDANLVVDLIAQSPLKSSVGNVLKQLNVSGIIQGAFSLNLPLKNPEKAVSSGFVNFKDNQMALLQPSMDFTQVTGRLNFENDKVTTDNLSLKWLGMPLQLQVNGIDKEDYYDTEINLIADWQEQHWQPYLDLPLKKYAQGNLKWKGDLSLYQHHNGGFSYDLTIDSSLHALQLNLPTPYGKPAEDTALLTINVNGELDHSTVNITVDDQLSFFGVLDHNKTSFTRAHVVLGDEEMLLPMDGFHITTKLAQVDFSQWQPLISDIIDSVNDSANSTINKSDKISSSQKIQQTLFAKPERIRGTLENFEFLGQTLHNVSFNLLDKENWWLLQLNAQETRSQIKIYPDLFEQGLDIDADFIHLSFAEKILSTEDLKKESGQQAIDEISDETSQEKQLLTPLFSYENDFTNIPSIKLHCDRCQIGLLNLGEVDFSLEHVGDELIKLNYFEAKRKQANLSFTGEWIKAQPLKNLLSTTAVTGEFTLKDIEYELKQLGYASIFRDSGGHVDFSLDWQGNPRDFDLSKINGDIKAKVDDGYLAEISDKARIFSVLSLQSLVRKLTLDFRDIFSDGMFYSDIKGDYHIKEGILYTDNTKMNGTAGDVFIKGNTNLASGKLDYKMSYKPNLTSSLPVLAWVATLSPATFLAGVAIDQVITSQVVSEFNFELTGDLENPNFREVNRKSRNVSVGRSTPPQFVDSTISPPKKNDGADERNNLKKSEKLDHNQFNLKQYPTPLNFNNRSETLTEQLLLDEKNG